MFSSLQDLIEVITIPALPQVETCKLIQLFTADRSYEPPIVQNAYDIGRHGRNENLGNGPRC